MNGTVITIPQDDDWYKKSFNTLVPLNIQGCTCEIVRLGEPPTMKKGSTGTIIMVNGIVYTVPIWAVKADKQCKFETRYNYNI
jgi:hypothetical protein